MTREGEHVPGHIVVVTSSYPSHPDDPSGHFVAAEVHALRASGARVTVLAPRVRGVTPGADDDVLFLPAGDAFGWPGALARLRQQPLRIFGALRFVYAARRELARLGDVERVIAHFLVPAAWPIALGARVPLEVVAHGSDVRLVERLPLLFRRRLAAGLRGAQIRSVSSELRSRLVRALGSALAPAIRVAPTPVAVRADRSRVACRVELGVPAEARLLLVVGRLIPSKRIHVALAAAALVPDAVTVVVGDGPERSRLERTFPDVRFVGRVPRSRALTWMAAADVLLSASRLEGAPSVIREARALATRVVALPAGDLGEWARADPGLHVLAGVA